MTEIKVWAPNAKDVALEIAGQRLPMEVDQWLWWRVDTALAEHGVDYAFIIDGGRPLPDPRSPWQPYGPHGASRWYDHSRFEWHDPHWSSGPLGAAVIYELHVGTFTPEGTFDALIGKLDYLCGLGVTHIELMPVAEFPGEVGWGYDGVDLFAPHHVYGGPDGFKRLVDACHQKGLSVILDVVYNHLGPDGNYLGQFGWYYTDRYKTPWGDAMNYDGRDNDEVRRFFLDNARMWLRDYHCDGLRLDAVHAIIDLTAMHFLEQLATEVDALQVQLGRRFVLIAESDLNDSRVVRTRELGGYGITAQWLDDFRHALWTALSGEQNGFHQDFCGLADLAKAYVDIFVYDGNYSHYRRRRHGRPAMGVPRRRFIGFLQNHDQVGNRAIGDRMNHVISPGLYRVAAAIVLTAPFVPMLFMGEEWAASTPFQYFTDHQDDELAEAVRKGRMNDFAAFGWEPGQVPDPQAPDTSRRSRLNWEELGQEPHAAMLAWYRKLIQLRRRHPALTAGDSEPLHVQFDEDGRWIVFGRRVAGETMMISANLGGQAQMLPCWDNGIYSLLLSSEPGIQQHEVGLHMPPESVAIWKRIG